MRRAAIRELVDGYFDGSEEQLMLFLRTPETPSAAMAASAPADEATGIDTVLL